MIKEILDLIRSEKIVFSTGAWRNEKVKKSTLRGRRIVEEKVEPTQVTVWVVTDKK